MKPIHKEAVIKPRKVMFVSGDIVEVMINPIAVIMMAMIPREKGLSAPPKKNSTNQPLKVIMIERIAIVNKSAKVKRGIIISVKINTVKQITKRMRCCPIISIPLSD